MTANEKLLHALEHQISNSDRRQIALYSALLGLNHLREQIEAQALASLEWKCSNILANCDPVNAADAYSIGWARGEGAELLELAKIHASIDLLERTPDVKAAIAALEPLCSERTVLRARVAADRAALAAAVGEAQEAERAALERAQLAAANDPALLAARERLDRLENPPPLVRGKFKVPAIA